MIPKIIHYCWFGYNPKPQLALDCIDSWKKYFPGYEIMEWNESNFDFENCQYCKQAYEAKKWAFVSDYARFKILYDNGGIYFDTDVEVIKEMTDIISEGPFMAYEAGHDSVKGSKHTRAIAPGLGLAAYPKMQFYKNVIEYYEKENFLHSDGSFNTTTVVARITDIMAEKGIELDEPITKFEGITIYSEEYFCPLNYVTGELKITENTRTIHHYTESWMNSYEKKISKINRLFSEKGKLLKQFARIITLPLRAINKINKLIIKRKYD